MKKVIYGEKEYKFGELIKMKGLEKHYQTIYQRIYNGNWSVEEAFDRPVRSEEIKKPTTDKQEERLEDMVYQRKLLNASKLESNRLDTRETRIINAFELLSENFKKVKAIIPNNKITFDSTRPVEYVLCIADLHCGAKFEHFTNEYSFEILEQRLEKIVQELSSMSITKLTLVSLGDLIQGMLRLSDIKLNESSVAESIVRCSNMLSKFIIELSFVCEYVEYISVPIGNHDYTRYFNDKGFVAETTVQIIDNSIRLACSEFSNISIAMSKYRVEDSAQLNIRGLNIIALHGHQVKNTKTAIRDFNYKYDKTFNLMLLGHFHHFNILETGKNQTVLACGSIVGECDYSRALNVSASASVTLIEISDNGIESFKNIFLN